MATRLEREHEWVAAAVLSERDRRVALHPTAVGCDRGETECAAAANAWVSNPRRISGGTCCAHRLNSPPHPLGRVLCRDGEDSSFVACAPQGRLLGSE